MWGELERLAEMEPDRSAHHALPRGGGDKLAQQARDPNRTGGSSPRGRPRG